MLPLTSVVIFGGVPFYRFFLSVFKRLFFVDGRYNILTLDLKALRNRDLPSPLLEKEVPQKRGLKGFFNCF
jgi:hypothetical protein